MRAVTARADYDFFSTEVRADPFPLFRRLRENDPVYRSDFGYWYVSTYADASRLVRDTRLGAGKGVPDSLGLSSGRLYDVMTAWMMALDGADHARVRRLISRAFTPRAVESLRLPIQALTDRLLDDLAARGSVEIVADFAFPIPMEVVRLLFGADASEWDKHVVELVRPGSRAAANVVEMMDALADYLLDVVARRRDAPGTDMFSAMVVPDDDGDRLSDHQLLANAVLLVTAGFETSMSLIALSILTLLRHPDQQRALRADPALVRNAVEEVLRFEPAALSTTRGALEDVELRGEVIPAGSNILFPMAAINRDPDRYPDPDTFDIARPDIRPLTFGGGVHVCLGAALARLEAEIAVGSFFGRFAHARLSDDEIEWQAQNPTVRRPVALHLHVGEQSK